jgi:tRNA(Ile)-lysidine synthase
LDSKNIIEDRLDDVLEKTIIQVTEDEIHYEIEIIKSLSDPKAYLYEMFNNYGFTEWNDVLNLLEAQSGKQVYSNTHRLIKDRDVLILTENTQEVEGFISVAETVDQVNTPIGIFFFDEADAIFGKRCNIINVDKDLLKFPLTLRKWKEGDYFYPFGMKGKKKLSKFFKDEKLSLVAKENTWLLCSGNDVVWVVNQRLDDRYKVTERTKDILKITLQE